MKPDEPSRDFLADFWERPTIPWDEYKTAPTPAELAETEAAFYRERLIREVQTTLETLPTIGVKPTYKQLATRIVDGILYQLVMADPETFTVAWHAMLAKYAEDESGEEG